MAVTVVLCQQLRGAMASKVLLRCGSGEHLVQRECVDDVSPTSDSSEYFNRSYLEASVSQKQMRRSSSQKDEVLPAK